MFIGDDVLETRFLLAKPAYSGTTTQKRRGFISSKVLLPLLLQVSKQEWENLPRFALIERCEKLEICGGF